MVCRRALRRPAGRRRPQGPRKAWSAARPWAFSQEARIAARDGETGAARPERQVDRAGRATSNGSRICSLSDLVDDTADDLRGARGSLGGGDGGHTRPLQVLGVCIRNDALRRSPGCRARLPRSRSEDASGAARRCGRTGSTKADAVHVLTASTRRTRSARVSRMPWWATSNPASRARTGDLLGATFEWPSRPGLPTGRRSRPPVTSRCRPDLPRERTKGERRALLRRSPRPAPTRRRGRRSSPNTSRSASDHSPVVTPARAHSSGLHEVLGCPRSGGLPNERSRAWPKWSGSGTGHMPMPLPVARLLARGAPVAGGPDDLRLDLVVLRHDRGVPGRR